MRVLIWQRKSSVRYPGPYKLGFPFLTIRDRLLQPKGVDDLFDASKRGINW